MEFIYPKVTVDDLLKYALVGGHGGTYMAGREIKKLTPKEHAYTEFLYDIDTILTGYNRTSYPILTRAYRNEFLKGKGETETRAYLQGQIDTLVAMYCDRYLPRDLCERKSITLDKSGETCMDVYVLQHLLSLNGFSIDGFENYENDSVAGKTIPIKFTGEFADEQILKEDFDRKHLRGASYLEDFIQIAKWNDENKDFFK